MRLNHLRTLSRANLDIRRPQHNLELDAGNCGDLATYAARRVVQLGGAAGIASIIDPDGIDPHAFAVVGTPPETETVTFEGWDDVWIIDPWANIVCEATAFNALLEQKMLKWAARGREVFDDGTQKWLSPADPQFLALVQSGTKRLQSPKILSMLLNYRIFHSPTYPSMPRPVTTSATRQSTAPLPPLPEPASNVNRAPMPSLKTKVADAFPPP